MKIKTITALVILESDDPAAIRCTDGQVFYGKIAGIDNPTESIILDTDNDEVAIIKISDVESIQAPLFPKTIFHQPKLLPAAVAVGIGVAGALAEPVTAVLEEIFTNGFAYEEDFTPPPRYPIKPTPGCVGKRTYHPIGCACGGCGGGGIWVDN